MFLLRKSKTRECMLSSAARAGVDGGGGGRWVGGGVRVGGWVATGSGEGISNNCQCNSLVVSFLTAFAMEKKRNQKTKSDPRKTKSWAPDIVPKWLS